MTVLDLLLIGCLIAFAAGLLWVSSALHRSRDWEQRLAAAHATLFARVGQGVLLGARHAVAAVRGPRRRMHLARCLWAWLAIGLLVVPPVVAEHLAVPGTHAGAGLTLTLGTIVWSALTELPGVVERNPCLSPAAELPPLIVLVLIVLALDAAVTMVVLGGMLSGSDAAAFALGASFIAVADLVSAGVGLTAAATVR